MRRKLRGYIFQYTSADHEGRHVHVFKDDRQVGVFDLHEGPIRGLEREWNRNLQAGLDAFIQELNDRGLFQR